MNNYRILLLAGLFYFLSALLIAQPGEIRIGDDYDQLRFYEFVEKLETEYRLRFFYDREKVPDFVIAVPPGGISLHRLLNEQLEPMGMYPSFDASGNIFITGGQPVYTFFPPDFFKQTIAEDNQEDQAIADDPAATKYLSTDKEYIPETVIIGTRKEGEHISRPTVSGYVTSAQDGSPIIYGTLYIHELEKGTTTDESGFYTISVRKGKYTLAVNSLESEEIKYKLDVRSDGRFDITLISKLYLLDEFVVSSDRNHNVRGSQMGMDKLKIKNIKEIPVVFGERDIVKVALLLPGVQSVGEGTAGFNVRGSPADQNLFYINTVPIYNTSHLFGFFSAFNSDAISQFTLMKSNIPAKYGGRLSSIFDIEAKQGNQKKFSARGGISPVTARIMVEGPIAKDKASYLVGIRSTYSDWILRFVDDPNIKNSSAYFGDAVANLTFRTDHRNQFNIFGYFSYDQANIASLTRYKYANLGGSASWHHLFREKHTLDVSVTTGRYGFEDQNMEYDFAAYQQTYELNHTELRADVTLRPNGKHNVTFGLNSVLYRVYKGDFLPLNDESKIDPKTFEPEKGVESGIYVSDDWKITPDLELSAGLRYNIYSYLGPKTVYEYQEGLPKEIDNITDTLSYGDNARISTYTGLDYRFGIKYLFSENFSVKAGYNKLHQYIFLLSNTIAISPTDIWKLCDYNIKPMTGQQASLGFYSNFMANYIEASVEGYYKTVDNLVEYKDGADLIANEVPEVDVVQGELEAYGIEFMIKKPYGRVSGWINYTYSRSIVTVNNTLTGEQNNFGISYPANYDKPHAMNLVVNYKISKRLNFSGTVVYATGRPITYPTAIFYQNGMEITHYSLRNEYRLPDYFRIDASINFEGNLKAKKFLHGSWSVSVYNLTGRKNAYSVYFKSEGGVIKGYRLSIFGSPIFSISYNFKLGNYDN